MTVKHRVWVTWNHKMKRFEVGWIWKGKTYRKYSWDIEGQHFSFDQKHEEIAYEFANYIRSQMIPKQGTDICTFDPDQFTKKKRGIYNFDRYFKETFLPRIQAKKPPRSKAYIDHLKRYHEKYWKPQFGEMNILEINETVLDTFYFNWMLTLDLTPKYIENIIDALRQMINEAFKRNKIVPPVFPDYEKGKKSRKVYRLTEEEQDQVLKYVPAKDLPVCMTISWLGLRMKEARLLKRKDFDLDKSILHVQTLKGGPARALWIEPELSKVIKSIPRCLSTDRLFHNEGKPYARSTLTRIMRKALDEAGFPEVWPNEFGRHSGLQNFLRRSGGNLRLTQQVAGHADIRTTITYTGYEIEDQKEVGRK